LVTHVALLLPTFDVNVVCFDLSGRFREPPSPLGMEDLPVHPGHTPRSFSRHANFFSDRPGTVLKSLYW
jgi:hypothetical protein